MAALTLKSLLSPRAGASPAVVALAAALGDSLGIEDPAGQPLFLRGDSGGQARVAVKLEDATLGWVTGTKEAATAVATLLEHLAAKETERRSLAAEVLHLYREVHLIEHLSQQLAAVLDLSAIGNSALEQARKLIAASHGGILVSDPQAGLRPLVSFGDRAPLEPSSQFVASVVDRGVAEIVEDCSADPRATEVERCLGSLLCAPLMAKQRVVGIIALANDAGKTYSTRDLKLLNTIAMQAAAAIENTLLAAEMVDAVRDREQLAAIQKELDTATTIQQSLIPRTFPPFPHRTDFDIHAQMMAASSVGGDFFDFFLIDEERLGLVIGDVSGKGVPAALYMAVTLTHLRSTAQQGMAPEDCLLEVNRVLVEEKVSSMFATCFYGILNTRTGQLRYCSGGHNPPYILRSADGTVEPLEEVGGLPLGMFGGLGYTGASALLASGDTLVLYTDGVPEGANEAREDFGEERLIRCLKGAVALDCRELIGRVSGELSEFTAGAPQFDDITTLAVRRA